MTGKAHQMALSRFELVAKNRNCLTVSLAIGCAASFVLFLWQRLNWPRVFPSEVSERVRLYEDLLTLVFISSFVMFLFVFLSRLKVFKGELRRWTEPFYHRSSHILLIVLSFYVPLFLYAAGCWFMYDWGLPHLENFCVLWMAVFGIIVASRVYLEVTGPKTINLNDFMLTAIQVLEDTEKNSTVYIIAPCLYLGELEPTASPMAQKFRRCLIDSLKRAGTNGRLLTLGFEKLDPLPDSKVLHEWMTKFNDLAKKHDSYGWLSTFAEQKINQDMPPSPRWYKGAIEFHNDLFGATTVLAADTADGKLYAAKTNREKGFFAVCNLKKGKYYLGEYDVTAFDDSRFEGTLFDERLITTQMKQMLESLITSNKKT